MSGKRAGGTLKGCLLSYFKQLDMPIRLMKPIKPELMLIQTEDGKLIIAKQFKNEMSLARQKEFLALLKEAGFHRSYTFSEAFPPFEYRGRCIGFLPYIHPHEQAFTYRTQDERLEGLILLKKMHGASKHISRRMSHLSDQPFNQVRKWKERLAEFKQNEKIIKPYMPEKVYQAYASMGKWVLKELKEEEIGKKDTLVIIHGDLAHHNFLRRSDGKLFLIDFDLMAKAPAIIDDLQYANRLLVYNSYSLEEILSLPPFREHRYNREFLIGLAYPTDIYREWNRVCRENLWADQRRMKAMYDYTLNDFQERMSFFKKIKCAAADL